jgi:NSS family neurotransmitter:Na+ symporter
MQRAREHWAGRFGFVLAAAGSAIGLGNLWKFPYISYANNGGAFVLIYIVSILIVGLPIMMAEIIIGRRTQQSAIPAFDSLGRRWKWIGVLGVITGFVILGYYSVIAGWSLSSFYQCMDWSLTGFEQPDFGAFIGDGSTQLLLSAAFSMLSMLVIWFGVRGGIEKVTTILMPILLVLLVYFVITSITLDGSAEALTFLFYPDFSALPPLGILEGLWHAFFTLSLGMGLMITYGSYLRRKDSIPRVAGMVVLMDTVVALLAAMTMFCIIFSIPGMRSEVSGSTVGMLFVTLPNLFYSGELHGGPVLGPLFYLFVAFAALTSTISLLEVLVCYFIDRHGWARHKATLFCGIGTYVNTFFCALSLGAVGFLSNFSWLPDKSGVLDHLDYLASNWMLPIGGFGISIFAGWVLDKKISQEELGMVDEHGNPTVYYKLWRVFVRFIAPAAILAVIIAVISGKDFS